MFTDEQFNEFMQSNTSRERDRELLIRIDENTKRMREDFLEHLKADSAEFALSRQSLSKVHERIDTTNREVASLKNRAIGIGIAVTAFVTIVQFSLSVYNGAKQARLFSNAQIRSSDVKDPIRNA